MFKRATELDKRVIGTSREQAEIDREQREGGVSIVGVEDGRWVDKYISGVVVLIFSSRSSGDGLGTINMHAGLQMSFVSL